MAVKDDALVAVPMIDFAPEHVTPSALSTSLLLEQIGAAKSPYDDMYEAPPPMSILYDVERNPFRGYVAEWALARSGDKRLLLPRFLSDHFIRKGEKKRPIAFTSLGGGSYSIPPNELPTFACYYAHDVAILGLRAYLCERIDKCGVFQLFADLDIVQNMRVSQSDALRCAQVYQRIIKLFYPSLPEAECFAVVLGTQYTRKGDKWKSGMHIHWPRIRVNIEQACLIASYTRLEMIKEFGSRPDGANSYDDLIDISVYKNKTGIRLVGAYKLDPRCAACNNRAQRQRQRLRAQARAHAVSTKTAETRLEHVNRSLTSLGQASRTQRLTTYDLYTVGLLQDERKKYEDICFKGGETGGDDDVKDADVVGEDEKEDECPQCLDTCKTDTNRYYMPMYVLDANGNRDHTTEVAYLKDFGRVVFDTLIHVIPPKDAPREWAPRPTPEYQAPPDAHKNHPTVAFNARGRVVSTAKKSIATQKTRELRDSADITDDVELGALQRTVRTAWEHYKDVGVRTARRSKDGNLIFLEIEGYNSKYCHNISRTHVSNNVYFIVTCNGIQQRCHDDGVPTAADVGEKVPFTSCATFKSHFVPFSSSDLARILFLEPDEGLYNGSVLRSTPPLRAPRMFRAARSHRKTLLQHTGERECNSLQRYLIPMMGRHKIRTTKPQSVYADKIGIADDGDTARARQLYKPTPRKRSEQKALETLETRVPRGKRAISERVRKRDEIDDERQEHLSKRVRPLPKCRTADLGELQIERLI